MEEMMLTLSTGALCVPVERDGKRVGTLRFDPDDPAFLNRFYALVPALEGRRAALASLPAGPEHAAEALAALESACADTRRDIDEAFGAGTSALVFGASCSPALLEQFFTGIAEILRPRREKKLAPHLAPADALS